MPAIRTVLFDLDGTLIDHFQTIYRCYVYAQEQLGLPPADYDKVRATVGGSVPITMERLIGSKELVEEAVRLFRAHFDEIMFEDLYLMPGVEWLLKALHEKGIKQAVFTNKRGEPSRKIMTHLGLDKYLDATIGTMDTEWKKPDPEFTRYAMEKVGAEVETTILIGDSPFDLAAAEAGALPAYLVATGSHSLDELRALTDPAPAGVYPDLVALGQDLFNCEPPASFAVN